jgi:transcriptional regulator with XRE-family HTH domain
MSRYGIPASSGFGKTSPRLWQTPLLMRLTPEAVGERIRAARLARGWTHDELASRMNVNWRTVQRWQKGAPPRLQTLLRLADVLGVPHGYFVDVEDSLTTLDELRERMDDLAARVESLSRALDALQTAPPERRRPVPRRAHRSAP